MDSVPVEIRLAQASAPKSNLKEARETAEREHILRALEETNWNVSGAARALGMERTNLHKRIRALGLSRASTPSPSAPWETTDRVAREDVRSTVGLLYSAGAL